MPGTTRVAVGLLAVALAGCSAPPSVAPGDAGSEFDVVSGFLVPDMESYRFGRVTAGLEAISLCRMLACLTFPTRVEAQGVYAECGRRFRPTGLGEGEYEGVFAQDFGPPVAGQAGPRPGGEVVAVIRGTPVHLEPAAHAGNADVGPTRTCWVAVVESRFCVIATSLDLMQQALERRGSRRELVSSLGLRLQPGWQAQATVVRRFPFDPQADTTHPLRLFTERTELARTAAIEGMLAETEDGRIRLTLVARGPALGAQLYRERFGSLTGVEASARVHGDVGEVTLDVGREGVAPLLLDLLFGLNWQL